MGTVDIQDLGMDCTQVGPDFQQNWDQNDKCWPQCQLEKNGLQIF